MEQENRFSGKKSSASDSYIDIPFCVKYFSRLFSLALTFYILGYLMVIKIIFHEKFLLRLFMKKPCKKYFV